MYVEDHYTVMYIYGKLSTQDKVDRYQLKEITDIMTLCSILLTEHPSTLFTKYTHLFPCYTDEYTSHDVVKKDFDVSRLQVAFGVCWIFNMRMYTLNV